MGTIRDKKLKNEEQRLIVSQNNKLIQKMSTDYDYERNLTKQSFVLDVYQRKMIALLIAHVSPDDEEFRMEKISFANFAKLMNIPKGGKTTELIHSSIAKLMGMSFCIEVKPRVYEYYHWIAGGCRVDEEERAIYIQLDAPLKRFLIGNKRHFTSYELGYISGLKGKYSCRMYEYMKSVGNLHMLNVRVETFSQRITDGVYALPYDLKRRVIEPSLKEINATSDIRVRYEEIIDTNASGRPKVTGYKFIITEKTYEEKQEIMSKWGIKFDDILLLEDGERPKFETVEEPKTKWFE